MPHWDRYVLNSSAEKEVALSESPKLTVSHEVYRGLVLQLKCSYLYMKKQRKHGNIC